MEQTTSQVDSKTEWFDNLVATLRSQELQLETGIASVETKLFYETFFAGNGDAIVHMGKNMAQKHFVGPRWVPVPGEPLHPQVALFERKFH